MTPVAGTQLGPIASAVESGADKLAAVPKQQSQLQADVHAAVPNAWVGVTRIAFGRSSMVLIFGTSNSQGIKA